MTHRVVKETEPGTNLDPGYTQKLAKKKAVEKRYRLGEEEHLTCKTEGDLCRYG